MIKSASEYHTHTSYDRFHMSGHGLDWKNQPGIYKTYPGLKTVRLPKPTRLPEGSLQQTMERKIVENPVIDIHMLSLIFALSVNITGKSQHQGQTFYYRSVASAGALYPNELYLTANNVTGLENGLYHYAIAEFSLTQLRTAESTVMDHGAAEADLHPVATFYITGIFFRSAWKYRKRAYRYILLDAGHVLENLLLSLKTSGLPFSVHYDFDDMKINTLLGVTHNQEACLAYVNIYRNSSKYTADTGDLNVDSQPLDREIQLASRVSENEIFYDEIDQIHKAGYSLCTIDKTSQDLFPVTSNASLQWRRFKSSNVIPENTDDELDYAGSIRLRRSKRNFIKAALPENIFERLLDVVATAIYQSAESHPVLSCLTTGLLTGNIEGYTPGFYMLDPLKRKTGIINKGEYTKIMAAVCLDQQWLANAAVHFLFLADLNALDTHFGPRGYRYIMMESGRIGQRIYLAATSLGLGCCGIGALYDFEAKDILELNETSALLYLVAAGQVKR